MTPRELEFLPIGPSLPSTATADGGQQNARHPVCSVRDWVHLASADAGASAGSLQTAVAIPFAMGSKFLVIVEAQAGNVGGLKFIVDTGATHSLIDQKIASRLKLQRYIGKTMNFDHSIPIEWAELPELQVGPLRAKGVRVMVVDLPKYLGICSGCRRDRRIGLVE